jgi:TIR domain
VLTILVGAGRWAREEMEPAITKRTEENIRIIPVLDEECERPELLRTLRYVDCRDHRESNFERQFSDMIDALNEVEVNPYR